MDERDIAIEAIRKRLVGKKLTYREIYAIMDQIANERLGDILTTYFIASGYSKGFSNEEIYYLTHAMVETGEKLSFRGIVADKHSIGGVPGTRTTLIVVPIVAAGGFKIPKSSSRAITTPSGTADAMEVLASVSFQKRKLYKIVGKVGGCIVWGGSFNVAPADEEIIKIEEHLLFESYDKILVSVMAKKVAFGSTHVVIDLPYGKTIKVHRLEDALILANKFEYLANKFNIKIKVLVHRLEEPTGQSVGPLLEARDALKVLEQTNDRPKKLEAHALNLASLLLKLCLEDCPKNKKRAILRKYQDTKAWAQDLLKTGEAHRLMREIIKEQKGNPRVLSSSLQLARFSKNIKSETTGVVSFINNKNLTIIARILGAPEDKKAGIYINKRLGNIVERREEVLILYSDSEYRLREAVDSLSHLPIFELEGK